MRCAWPFRTCTTPMSMCLAARETVIYAEMSIKGSERSLPRVKRPQDSKTRLSAPTSIRPSPIVRSRSPGSAS